MKQTFVISVISCLLGSILSACHKPGPDSGTGTAVLEFTSFTPEHGIPGQLIKLVGNNFHLDKEQNLVAFAGNTAIAEVVEAKANELTVKVPFTATSGKISIRVGNRTVVSAQDFMVDPVVAITGFLPLSGNIGTHITITGVSFDANPIVKIGGVTATILDKSATSIKVSIPTGLAVGAHKVTISGNGQTVEAAELFTVLASPNFNWSAKLNVFNVDKIYADATAFVYGNTLFMGLGKDLSATPYANNDRFWSYDKTAGRWNAANTVPAGFALRDRALAITYSNKVYVGLGIGKSDWWELADPNDPNSWRPLTPFPLTTETRNAFAFVANNNLYVAGVNTTGARPFPTIIYQFHPAGNSSMGSWTEVARIPFAIYYSASFVIGNEVYIGGELDPADNTRPYYKFSPLNNNAVAKVAGLPAATINTRRNNAFSLNGKGYVLATNKVYEYTPTASGGQWRLALDNPNAPEIHYGAVVEGKAYGWDFLGNVYEFKQ